MADIKRSISVLMPVRNGEKFLTSAIENISKCTTVDNQIVVVNDGSTDRTSQILARWKKNFPNVEIVNGPGEGLVKALNKGMEVCTGEWIARFDVDDICAVERLTIQASLIDSKSSAVFSDYSLRNINGVSGGFIATAIYPLQTQISLISARRTPHPSAMFRKQAAMDVGGYLERDRFAEDLSLWMRLSKVGTLHTVPQNLLTYSISPMSVSGQRRREMHQAKNRLVSNFIATKLNFEDIKRSLEEIPTLYEKDNRTRERYFLGLMELKTYFENAHSKNSRTYLDEVNFKMHTLMNIPEYFRFYGNAFRRKVLRRIG